MISITRNRYLLIQITLIILVLLTNVLSADDAVDPVLDFIDPTPDDGDYQTERYVEINVSIEEENLDELNYNWNGTNYTMYDDTLVLMYNFDNIASLGEDSSTVVDMSGNGNSGSVTQATWTSLGKYHGAFDFDGNGDYISCSADLNQWLGGTASLSVWIKTTQTGDLDPWDSPTITGFEEAGGGNDIFWGFIDNNGKIGIQAGNTEGAKTASAVNDGSWHHIAMTRDSTSGEVKIYLDGSLSGTATSDSGQKTSSFYSIGRLEDGAANVYYDGLIDEARIWDSELNSEQIYQLYASNLQKYNSTQWYLTINQSKDATSSLDDGTYTYQAFATDESSNEANTEERTIHINMDPSPPVPETATLVLLGIGFIILIFVTFSKKEGENES